MEPQASFLNKGFLVRQKCQGTWYDSAFKLRIPFYQRMHDDMALEHMLVVLNMIFNTQRRYTPAMNYTHFRWLCWPSWLLLAFFPDIGIDILVLNQTFKHMPHQ